MSMTCEHVDNVLSAWFEGDLELPERRAVDAHLRGCLRCASLVRDVEGMRRQAAALPELEPSRDLWAGIAARIETPIIELTPRQTAAPARRTWQMAAAAVVLMAVSSGVTYVVTTNGQREGTAADGSLITSTPIATPSNVVTPPRPTTGAGSTVLVRAEPMPAEVVYGQEIARLRTILDERRAGLDSSTVVAVERSLNAIDDAIADARAALAIDGSNQFLNEQLNRALEKKLGVLRRVALLPMGAS
jgi:hypothetical protein